MSRFWDDIPLAAKCDCRPSDGFHQYHCAVSRRMRAALREAGTPLPFIDPNNRARVVT